MLELQLGIALYRVQDSVLWGENEKHYRNIDTGVMEPTPVGSVLSYCFFVEEKLHLFPYFKGRERERSD